MRLIDADELIKKIHEIEASEKCMGLDFVAFIDEIKLQPTTYDVNKVVWRLEEEREDSHADFEQYAELHGIDTEDDWFYAGLIRAIEIVKAGEKDES